MVHRLRLNCSRGPSGIWAEYLRKWLGEAMREEAPDATHCQKVGTIIQAVFCDGTLLGETLADKST